MSYSVNQMRSLLKPIGLYALNGDTLIDKELSAYGVGFKLLEDALALLENSAFPQTALGQALELWENQLGLYSDYSNTVQKRQDLIVYRLSVAPQDFYFNGLLNSVRAAGLDALIETIGDEKISITSLGFLSKFESFDDLKRSVYSMLPAHLEPEFHIGTLTWEMFDLAGHTFSSLDAKDFTWEWFDINGGELVEQ